MRACVRARDVCVRARACVRACVHVCVCVCVCVCVNTYCTASMVLRGVAGLVVTDALLDSFHNALLASHPLNPACEFCQGKQELSAF